METPSRNWTAGFGPFHSPGPGKPFGVPVFDPHPNRKSPQRTRMVRLGLCEVAITLEILRLRTQKEGLEESCGSGSKPMGSHFGVFGAPPF